MKTRNIFILMIITNINTGKTGRIYDSLSQEITKGEVSQNEASLDLGLIAFRFSWSVQMLK